MNIEQALDELKRCLPFTNGDFQQALTIAIECMENLPNTIVHSGEGIYTNGIEYFNSLNRPQSDTETGI